MFVASRGLGKSFLSAIYCVTRCILYPETKIIITAPVKSQGINILEKIEGEIMSPMLAREIENINTGNQKPSIDFHNGSWIKVVASNDNARGHRANLLLVDEFVKVDADTIDMVFKKMLTAQREPKFLHKPEYADYPREENMQMYLSSAWMKSHWSYNTMMSYVKQMLNPKAAKDALKTFVCHVPYYTGVMEKLYSHKQMKAEAQQDGFNEMKFAMEMEARWWGESEAAFFNFNKIDMNRKLTQAFYPREVTEHTNITNPEKEPKEIRILSVDVARMGGNSNDASVFSLLRLVPKGKQYERQLCYMQDMEGQDYLTQTIRVRQLYDDFDCDYIVLDLKNVGTGILDNLRMPITDTERGVDYDPLNVCNNDDLAAQCRFPEAPRVIHTISATNERNMDMANMLADNFMRGKFRLLIHEDAAEERFIQDKRMKYLKLNPQLRAMIRYPYRQTELFIGETMNLEQVNMDGGAFKLVTSGTARKDRYSSVSYGNSLAVQLEKELVQQTKNTNFRGFFKFKKPKQII